MKRLYFLGIPALVLGAGLVVNAFASAGHGFGPEQFFAHLDKLHDELTLSAVQEAQWQQAASKTRDAIATMRATGRSVHERLRDELDQPAPDLRSLSVEMDRFHEQHASTRKALRQEWLAVYEQLNPDQKAKVAQYLKQRLERFGQWRHRGPSDGIDPYSGGG